MPSFGSYGVSARGKFWRIAGHMDHASGEAMMEHTFQSRFGRHAENGKRQRYSRTTLKTNASFEKALKSI